MTRIYPAFAYSDTPRANCWWDQTIAIPAKPALVGSQKVDVAVIGAGFTGVSAALHLAKSGVSVAVLDSNRIGWGASGRNGGFCCLGGGMLENAALEKQFGREGRQEWRQTEADAIRLVEELIAQNDIDVDRHSDGETQLAHRASDFEAMKRNQDAIFQDYGVTAKLTSKPDLARAGLNAEFHGAMTIPLGFGLNPRKYLNGIATAAESAGAQIFERSKVTSLEHNQGGYSLRTKSGALQADNVVIATNGYSSEDLPSWLKARYMPTQSSIMVTRPLGTAEIAAQGWTSRQMSFDTRHLLHYFRLMPDNRMLFGVRGGLMACAGSETRAMRRARADFERMFPAWSKVETTHSWSGMVCIARNMMPFVGKVPGQRGLFASLCYHGNGVAMASYSGALIADQILGIQTQRIYPKAVRRPLARFELGRFRRAVVPFLYMGFAISDR